MGLHLKLERNADGAISLSETAPEMAVPVGEQFQQNRIFVVKAGSVDGRTPYRSIAGPNGL